MEIERSRAEFKALIKIVKKASLKEIYLQSCQVKREVNASDFDRVEARISFSGSLSHEKDNDFWAKCNIALIGSLEEDEDKEIVRIEADYILGYSLDDKKDISSEELDVFCNMNALYNAWPFFREMAHNMSSRMEIPSFTLPLLKFSPAKPEVDKKHQKKND